jgi:phosphoserine aminotransferase
MARAHVFNAGPAALPVDVLKKAQAELLEFDGQGMSVMELSHRSKAFAAVLADAEANLRRLMGISDDYAVLFLQGGASQQFAMIPTNLMAEGATCDYVHTGSWSAKAIKEAQIVAGKDKVNLAWDGKSEDYRRAPKTSELNLTDGAAYVHICSNETIAGVRYATFPDTDAPLLADMSSEIMSREMDVSKFGMIYAGTQKNLGPSGMAVVILRKDLAERVADTVPTFWKYTTHIEKNSTFNTPNTWAIYMVKLVTDWISEQGGVAAVQKVNEAKAAMLYDLLDTSDFYKPVVTDTDSRSIMNVTWRLANEDLEATLVDEAAKAGLIGLKGHRSVGGLRASIYNAVPKQAVEDLVAFLKDFQAKNG